MNQCFQDFFIGFVIVVHLVTIKKFDICLLAGWSSTLFILLVNIFDHTFNLFINNIVRYKRNRINFQLNRINFQTSPNVLKCL